MRAMLSRLRSRAGKSLNDVLSDLAVERAISVTINEPGSASTMPIHREYRQLWVKAGYDERMGSAWVCEPPAAHLLRVYHFTSARYALEDIEYGRLKVARFADLNDPFELLGVNFKFRGVRKVIRNFKAEYSTQTGLVCFSRNWTSPTLWSHYSDRHRGICLGFNVPKTRLEHVEYAQERLKPVEPGEGEFKKLTPKLQQQLLRTKSAHWQHEEEVRFFVQLKDMVSSGSLHFCPFDDNLELVEVIVGQSAKDLALVRAAVKAKYPGAITHQARLAFGSFAIVPDERHVP